MDPTQPQPTGTLLTSHIPHRTDLSLVTNSPTPVHSTHRAPPRLSQEPPKLLYQIHRSPLELVTKSALLDFLNVGISLRELWEDFSASDCRFAELAKYLAGARVLKAKYITGTVDALHWKPRGGAEWFMSLCKLDLQEVIDALCTLPGVGPKVAACIAFFSLDQHHAILVDTHVWQASQIATRYLLPELAGARLTPKLCNRFAHAFVSKYGKYAGWAQTLLFIAELPSQKAILPSIFFAIKENKSTKRKEREASSGS